MTLAARTCAKRPSRQRLALDLLVEAALPSQPRIVKVRQFSHNVHGLHPAAYRMLTQLLPVSTFVLDFSQTNARARFPLQLARQTRRAGLA